MNWSDKKLRELASYLNRRMTAQQIAKAMNITQAKLARGLIILFRRMTP